ncbi:MAG: hypothetical protein LBJ69_02120, partial [Holosporales bacterium]|nr:hypothetical protein [Holosporales bacterium]
MRPGVLERESSVVRSIPTRTVFKTQEDILEAVSGISHQITQVSTDLETKIESLASAPGNHTETPGESTPVVDIDTTEITSTLGEIKSALTDEEAGL